ncbi:MAG TPA: lytic transglycosylase domain-containing protein, partial [Dissulfurispiraceae bacterium]|nr:lytic transglycosylase domain-containing protein [Dissulfurispiraceae bacterium]
AVSLIAFSLSVLLAFCGTEAKGFCFDDAAKKYELSADLLRAIARTESGMRANAVNRNSNGSFDIGVMQINSFWFPKFGLTADQLKSDPCLNVMTGADILSRCVKSHGYTWEAVGCYNAYSHAKRVAYSWRIYRNLKADAKRVDTVPREKTAVPEKRNSSLHFVVRDQEI